MLGDVIFEFELFEFLRQLVLDDLDGALIHLLDLEQCFEIDLIDHLPYARLEVSLEVLVMWRNFQSVNICFEWVRDDHLNVI